MMSLLYRAADRLRQRADRRTMPETAANGRRGEDLAHRLLRREGFTVVARNYRPPAGGGEIDLIARQGDEVAFVEVKTRLTADFGSPDSAIDAEKRAAVERSARDYARRAGIPWEQAHFHVVNVVLSDPPTLELIRDAFRTTSTI
jgi:putative endonuclease